MANIFDYLAWRGDLSFNQSPFNPVDAMIFCQLSYLPFDNIVPVPDKRKKITLSAAARLFRKKHEKNTLDGFLIFKDDPDFLELLGRSSRFMDCILHSYVNHIDEELEKQFSAVCIDTGAFTFIAYRGTDVSLVGWKEDLNMSFSDAVPSQLEAVSYLEESARRISGPLLIGGHSKGGNLAVYAASSCKKNTCNRVKNIYSFDAPGFHRRLIAGDGFQRILNRINLFIPQFSIIGLLFEHGKDPVIVKSSQMGINQHDLYTWELIHNDLVRFNTQTRYSRFMDKTLKEWIGSLDYNHRREFTEALFLVLNATQAKSFVDISSDWLKASSRMIQTLGNIDNSTKKIIRKTIALLFEAAKKNINTLIKEKTPVKKAKPKKLFILDKRK
jgi:hypothetical protein